MMNKNKLIPLLIPGLTFIAPAVYAEKDYSDYFAYDVSTVKYVETTANAQASLPAPSAQAVFQPQTTPQKAVVPVQAFTPVQTTQSEIIAPAQNRQTEPRYITNTQLTQNAEAPAMLPPMPAASGSGYEIYANTPESFAPAPETQPQIATPMQKPAISQAVVAQAIASGDINRLQELQAQGANLHIADAQGTTYLHKAAAAGNLALVEWLLSAGVDPNATTEKHWTPLHHAARFGHTAVAQALIAAGANQQQANSDGFRPKQLAINTRQTKVAALLQ